MGTHRFRDFVPLACYGCTRCQQYHDRRSPVFEDHLFFQSKHGLAARALDRNGLLDPVDNPIRRPALP